MKLALLLGFVAACGNDRNQIVLAIDTAVGIPCEVDTIRVQAGRASQVSTTRDLKTERLPLEITLEDDTSDGNFDLAISGLKGSAEVLRVAGPLQFGAGDALGTRIVLESSCTPENPCPVPMLETYAGLPAPASRSSCGENVRRYTPAAATETFRDVCTVPGANAGKVLADGARGAALLPLPAAALEGFSFEFYGKPVRQVWVHEQGYLAFTQNSPDPNNDLDPGAFDRDLIGAGVPPPSQSVFPFWDSLTLGAEGVCYALEGSPGTQKLRVTWKGTCQTVACSASNNLNFTVVLDERNNRVSLTYGEMTGTSVERAQGATATSGIVNVATGCPIAECTFETGLCSDGQTPCGYSQVFSNMPQAPRVLDVQFDPIVDTE